MSLPWEEPGASTYNVKKGFNWAKPLVTKVITLAFTESHEEIERVRDEWKRSKQVMTRNLRFALDKSGESWILVKFNQTNAWLGRHKHACGDDSSDGESTSGVDSDTILDIHPKGKEDRVATVSFEGVNLCEVSPHSCRMKMSFTSLSGRSSTVEEEPMLIEACETEVDYLTFGFWGLNGTRGLESYRSYRRKYRADVKLEVLIAMTDGRDGPAPSLATAKVKQVLLTCQEEEPLPGLKYVSSGVKYTDFKVVCKDVTFPCHKYVLASRSEYFSNMLSHKSLEAKTGKVCISDTDPRAVEAMIQFLYEETLDIEDANHACKILQLADQYQIQPLSTRCQKFLLGCLGGENVLDILRVGLLLNLDCLIKGAETQIWKDPDVIFTLEFDGFKEDHPAHAAKIREEHAGYIRFKEEQVSTSDEEPESDDDRRWLSSLLAK